MRGVALEFRRASSHIPAERKHVHIVASLSAASSQLIDNLFDSVVGIRKINLVEMGNFHGRSSRSSSPEETSEEKAVHSNGIQGLVSDRT
jgi:hypothetical protein